MAGPQTPPEGADSSGSQTEIARIRVPCIDDVHVDGGGVSVLTRRGFSGTVWVSDSIRSTFEVLQFTWARGRASRAAGHRYMPKRLRAARLST